MDFVRPDINFDFIGKRRIAMILSLIAILLGVGSLVLKGGPLYGIDFAGGTLVQVRFSQAPGIGDVRDVLSGKGMGSAVIQSQGEEAIAVRVKSEEGQSETISDEVFSVISEGFPELEPSLELVEMVGPQVGADLRRKGILSLVYAILGILLYITLRFQFRFALGAVAALVHDVLITVGVFSIMGIEFTLPIIAAVLTIIGYSLNDTIVVFDRIRENIRRHPKEKLATVVNESINQTLSRTILTSGTTLLVVFCLFLFGGKVIHDFSFALLIGIMVGTYSSIFIASPVLLLGGKGESASRTSIRQA
ncbi:MAG: protein translocase subunit SecF [Proteobacteria bacterium]|nr:protein translocase subunit SecF [Pseudomonadota bacterium]